MKIEGLNVVVTGGASGLGKATALRLHELGATVTIADINAQQGQLLVNEHGVRFSETDVRHESAVDAMFAKAEDAHGKVRAIVNCAGIAPDIRLTRREGPHRVDAFQHTLDVNVLGTFLCCSRFAHRLRDPEPIDEESGVIINVASIAAFDGHTGHTAYAASKAAVVGMTLPMARELAVQGIRVMCIAPGVFDTPMMDGVPNPHRVDLASQTPFPNRLGEPKEFASLVEHLIVNPMMNGEVIRIDGALRLGPQ